MQVQIIRPDGRSIVVGGQGADRAVPRSRAELDALTARRSELQSQVERLRSDREILVGNIDEMGDSPGRAALQLRLAEVDTRILRIDRQLDAVNDQIAAAPAAVTSQVFTTVPPRRDPMQDALVRNIVPLTGIISVFFLFPLALAFARLLWKRGTAVASRPALNEQAMVSRFDQLQNSLDAMALEVERISENQRYVTKLMSERERAALPR